MARFSAVLDACALVPIAQADTLLCLAETDLYRPLWSTRILDEAVRALETIHTDMKRPGAARARADVMNTAFDDACVDGWERLLNAINLPDEFLMNQLDLDPERVMAALRVQAAATRNPPLTVADVLGRLERCGALEFAASARRQLWRTR